MSKKKYGIDLDGVCFDFGKAFGHWMEDKRGIPYHQEEITSYYWFECVKGLTKGAF